jgi:uncharacterized protein (DUF2336 family)
MRVMLNPALPSEIPDEPADLLYVGAEALPSDDDAPIDIDAIVNPPDEFEGPPEPKFLARHALMKRLADVVCLPESRINAFERAVTADLLVEMLRDASVNDRGRVARRLSVLAEVPNSLVRLLIVDEIDVARHLIENCDSLNDADLYFCARHGLHNHRLLLAQRKGLSAILCEALVESEEMLVIEALLRNLKASLSQPALESVVAMSQNEASLIPLIMRRPELRPSSAYVLFWWCGTEIRRQILSRFGVNRDVMQDMASDIFAMAAQEHWQDPMSRKALQFIERRQRNREALKKSPYDSLEAAIMDAAEHGMTRKMAEEISYLSGLKPSTGAKLLRDKGGEGLAVLCKATGMSKKALRALWRALRRPLKDADGAVHPDLGEVLITFDMLATDRAQTVLRYWNWALSSALTHVMLKALSRGEELDLETLSVPQRAAMLAFSQDLKT